jgi:nitrile hydratase accessory protein
VSARLDVPLDAALDISGPTAPPRANGELVFAAPWESRAFGLAVTLAADGRFAWDDFRARLVARIAEAPAAPYYERWLAALEDVLAAADLVDADDRARRAGALAERAPGHDHAH